jgi:hypothetical protein
MPPVPQPSGCLQASNPLIPLSKFPEPPLGTGQAGAQAAIALRQLGETRLITMIGDEPGFPYERPPPSKDFASQKSAKILNYQFLLLIM